MKRRSGVGILKSFIVLLCLNRAEFLSLKEAPSLIVLKDIAFNFPSVIKGRVTT